VSPVTSRPDAESRGRIVSQASPASLRAVSAAVRSFKRLVKRSPLWPILRPRRFHAYCVGPAKSGTVSVNGMFSSSYRSGHEAAFLEVIEMAISRLDGRLTPQAAMRRLRKRDRKLQLEMDSFNQLSVFVEELVEAFPRAIFLLTVREPRSWLRSIVNQHLNVDVSNRAPERRLRQLFFGPPGATYSSGEEELERLGLFPLDGYLSGWSAHYRRVMDAVPSQRLLVIRTKNLSGSVDRLAEFLSIAPDSINTERSHMHRCPRDHGVVGRLDSGLVEDKVASNCEAVMSRIVAVIDALDGEPHLRG